MKHIYIFQQQQKIVIFPLQKNIFKLQTCIIKCHQRNISTFISNQQKTFHVSSPQNIFLQSHSIRYYDITNLYIKKPVKFSLQNIK